MVRIIRSSGRIEPGTARCIPSVPPFSNLADGKAWYKASEPAKETEGNMLREIDFR